MNLQTLQRRAPHLLLLLVGIAGLFGLLAFYLALRPCILEIPPGNRVSYALSVEFHALETEEGLPSLQRREDYDLHVYGLNASGEAALLVRSASAQRSQLYHVHLQRNGQVQLRDADLVHDHGPSISYFDFNLLPLPPGLDQSWDERLIYAYPPPAQRHLATQVRRSKNGIRPRFRWRVPAIEWVERSPAWLAAELEERYVQLRMFDVSYRFDTARGWWSDAQIRFIAGVEMPGEGVDAIIRHRVDMDLQMMERSSGEDPLSWIASIGSLRSLRQAVLRQDANGVEEALRALRAEPPDDPYLQAHIQRWYEDLNADPSQAGERVQVASTRSAAAAKRLRWELIADGYPAHVQQSGAHWTVLAGPFARRDERVLADLRSRYPSNAPFWVNWER